MTSAPVLMDGRMKNETEKNSLPKWFEWAREIQSLAQTGLTFSQNHFEKDRNTRLMELAAEIISTHSKLGYSSTLESMLEQPGYATPKIDVRAAVLRDNKILLVQEAEDQKWCMPGGWADVGDEPAESVIREVKEESGYDVVVKKVIGVFDANRDGRPMNLYHAFKIVFLCEITGGKAKVSPETLAVEFFELNALPPLSQNRTHARHIEEVSRHIADPARISYFE